MFASRKELFHGATSVSSICGSALMWSWWDLAFYSGIFLNWTPGGQDLIVPSFVVGMLTSGGALLLMAFLAQQISPILYRGRLRQLVVGAVAGIASVGCVGAAWLHSLPLALICSSINGVCLAVMLALWGTLWFRTRSQLVDHRHISRHPIRHCHRWHAHLRATPPGRHFRHGAFPSCEHCRVSLCRPSACRQCHLHPSSPHEGHLDWASG